MLLKITVRAGTEGTRLERLCCSFHSIKWPDNKRKQPRYRISFHCLLASVRALSHPRIPLASDLCHATQSARRAPAGFLRQRLSLIRFYKSVPLYDFPEVRSPPRTFLFVTGLGIHRVCRRPPLRPEGSRRPLKASYLRHLFNSNGGNKATDSLRGARPEAT